MVKLFHSNIKNNVPRNITRNKIKINFEQKQIIQHFKTPLKRHFMSVINMNSPFKGTFSKVGN